MTHSFEAMVAMTTPGSQKALRILAKSIHRELKAAGYSRNDIVQLSGELLELVTTDIRTSEAPGR